MSQVHKSKGIMGKPYAVDRRSELHLIFRYKVRARVVADAARRWLGTLGPFRILDLGSAEGLTLLELRSLLPFGTYVGVEFSDELLQCVPELPSDTRIVKGDVMNLPESIKDEPYDVVTALALLEHLSDPLKGVQEAASILRPGGIFIATCPAPLWETISTSFGLLQGEHHETQMSKERMIEVVQNSGMDVLIYQSFMWAPIGVLPYIKVMVPPSFFSQDRPRNSTDKSF